MNFSTSDFYGFQYDAFAPIYLSTYLQKPICVLYSTHNVYSYSYL